MASQFSKDGKYFAQISNDGKLKLWNTLTNKFEQEFTPDFHLTSPCVCLHFVLPESTTTQNGAPRKKIKRRSSAVAITSPFVILGTTSGLLLNYSIAKGELDFTIDSKTNQSISCLSWQDGVEVYSAIEQNVVSWDLQKKSIKSKWKAGNEKITSILQIPESSNLLTASKNIKLWDSIKREVLATFTGHSSDITHLNFVNPALNDGYFVSCSKADRIISCWSLDGTKKAASIGAPRNAVESFQTEDVVHQINLQVNSEGITEVAAVTRSGVCHIYVHTLNGQGNKPLKPKTTLRVVSDTNDKGAVIPIPIAGAYINDDGTVTIAHGNAVHLLFEKIVLNSYEKLQCIIRKDMRAAQKQDDQVSKTKRPIVDGEVHYLTPHTLNSVGKRRAEGTTDVPMEKRLENLTLNKLDSTSKVPKANNVAQLLLQGIHSKDKNILRTVLNRRDETVINNTIKRLPMSVIVPLVMELTNLIQGKTLLCQTGILWLKSVLQIHAGILVSNPELVDLLTPVMSSIESRLSLQTPLNRLRGRLDLLVSQLSVSNVAEEADNEALLVYNDKASSDSEMDGMEIGFHSDSENEWLEDESESENDSKVGENGDLNSGDEMST